MNKLNESILDLPKKELAYWLVDKDGKINEEIRTQILSIIANWKKQINFSFKITKIVAKGSLLTNRYSEDTDLDVSVYTTMNTKDRDSVLDIVPRGNKIVLQGAETQHPIDFYILSKGETTPEKNLDAIYDVFNRKWIKEPDLYENPIPLSYVLSVSEFFIHGAQVAITDFDNDLIIYKYFKEADPQIEQIAEDEKEKALVEQRRKLQEDVDAMSIALHMISSFRHEAYNEESTPFKISIKVESDNPHLSINEQLPKMLEKVGIKEKLTKRIKEGKALLEADSADNI